jgi:hypothetical protein
VRWTEIGPRHWAEVGGTFGARMAAAVEQAPLYYWLVGPGLLTRAAAHRIAAGFPSHRWLRPAEAARALDFRPTPCGWRDLNEPWPPDEPAVWADVALGELAERTHRYHDQPAPTGPSVRLVPSAPGPHLRVVGGSRGRLPVRDGPGPSTRPPSSPSNSADGGASSADGGVERRENDSAAAPRK